MLMSAKTPGSTFSQMDSKIVTHNRQQLAMHPPLVNIGIRASLADNDDNTFQSSLLFGPEGAMLLPIDPSNDIQLSQPVDQGQGSPTSLSAVAVSPSLVSQHQALSSVVVTDTITQPSTISLSITSASATISPATTSLPQPSTESSSTSQVQSLSQSQTQTSFVASILSSAMSTEVISATTHSTLTSAIPSLTTSQALSSPSSTSALQRDFASLPRVAEIVIGIVGAISLIAFLATLGSWIYKQRNRKREHAEIISITSFGDSPQRGFFGRLKKRSDKHPDDMSELGFGLGRVTFFNEPNSGDEHHHVGIAHGAENVVLDDEDKTDDTFLVPPNPFTDHLGDGIIRRVPSTERRFETMDAASSISISPYQHLASTNALGGASATPLTVANPVPGDTSGDEGGGHSAPLLAPPLVTRYPSVGTPRIGVSDPRFVSLIEDEALAVPWAPLDIRRSELRALIEDRTSTDLGDEEEARERDTGFRQLQLSRTETLTLAVSKTFSQRLGRSLSKMSNWRSVVTRPPPGTFEAERDNVEVAVATNGAEKHWTTTLKNNFYSALNAVGGSIHATNAGSNSADPEAPPINPTRTISELNIVPYKGELRGSKDPLEDILTPPPARVAAVRLERTKGSIIRRHLGIAPGGGPPEYGTGLGLGLESLSRSSTLSTCWSDNEKEPNEETMHKVRIRVRRSDTSSTASSVIRFMSSGGERLGSNGRHMKRPSKRPRISRVPVSQSSMWSSTSYASTNGEERSQ